MTNRDARNDAPDELHTPTQIVCVYAQSDQQWYDDLKTYLVHWERAKKITWLNTQAGADTTQTMEKHLKRADHILLLLSPTFFAVYSCSNVISLVLHEKEQRQVPIVPIIVRACDWKDLTCGGRKALPDYDSVLPLAHWKHPEQIRAGLARLVPGLDPDGQSIRSQLFQAHDLPKGYLPRPKAFGEIKHLLLNHQGNQPTAVTTALRGIGGFVSSCAVSPDGRFIVSASNDEILMVWDVVTGAVRFTLTGHTDPIFGCAVSLDGRFIVSASGDETLKVWDAQTGLCLLTFLGEGALFDCTFHPDEEHLVACGTPGVYVLRLVM